jgi:hypothetical protein
MAIGRRSLMAICSWSLMAICSWSLSPVGFRGMQLFTHCRLGLDEQLADFLTQCLRLFDETMIDLYLKMHTRTSGTVIRFTDFAGMSDVNF